MSTEQCGTVEVYYMAARKREAKASAPREQWARAKQSSTRTQKPECNAVSRQLHDLRKRRGVPCSFCMMPPNRARWKERRFDGDALERTRGGESTSVSGVEAVLVWGRARRAGVLFLMGARRSLQPMIVGTYTPVPVEL